jgi:hypothetical protein
MDPLLGLILALLAFAFFVFLIGRAFRYVIVLGCALIGYFALTALGVIG